MAKLKTIHQINYINAPYSNLMIAAGYPCPKEMGKKTTPIEAIIQVAGLTQKEEKQVIQFIKFIVYSRNKKSGRT